MTKKTKIIVCCIVAVLIAAGLAWWYMPVHFLRNVPEAYLQERW